MLLAEWWEYIPVVSTLGHAFQEPPGVDWADYNSARVTQAECQDPLAAKILCEDRIDVMLLTYIGNYVGVSLPADFIKTIGGVIIAENMQRHESKNEQNNCLKDFMQKRNKDTKVYHAKIINDDDRNNAEYTLFVYFGATDLLCNENTPYGEYVYSLNFPFEKIELNY